MGTNETTASKDLIDIKLPAVQVLIFQGFDELDAVGPYEVLSGAGFDVRFLGWDAQDGKIHGAHGIVVHIDQACDAVPGLFIVPGGGWLVGRGLQGLVTDSSLTTKLARLHEGGTVMASVCTGAMLLASAGLLKGRPAVTNRSAFDDLRAAGADVQEAARVVDDGDVVTAAGPTAGIDLAIRLVERYLGEEAGDHAAARVDYVRPERALVTSNPWAVP